MICMGDEEDREQDKVHTLCPIDIRRSRIHTVHYDADVQLLHDSAPCTKA